jgi:hypothetical protein
MLDDNQDIGSQEMFRIIIRVSRGKRTDDQRKQARGNFSSALRHRAATSDSSLRVKLGFDADDH